jgi:hypothetical protein
MRPSSTCWRRARRSVRGFNPAYRNQLTPDEVKKYLSVLKHMPLRATKTAESKTDRDEVAQIRTMLGDHTAHNRADCIAIGEHVYRHLERKGLSVGRWISTYGSISNCARNTFAGS